MGRSRDPNRHRAGIACRLHVALAIADHDTALRIHADRSRGIEDEFRLGLSAFARVFGCMRANEKAGKRAEQFVNAAIHGVDLLHRYVSAPDAALIAYHGQRQAGRAQAIEQLAGVRRRLDPLGVTVKGHVDHDRFVAIEEDRARGGVCAALRLRASRSAQGDTVAT